MRRQGSVFTQTHKDDQDLLTEKFKELAYENKLQFFDDSGAAMNFLKVKKRKILLPDTALKIPSIT